MLHLSKACCAALALTAIWWTPADAQSLNRDLTDPDAIAAECGGSANLGAPVFAQSCAACHSLTADDTEGRAGPHLAELYGRTSFSLPDFPYSEAAQEVLVVWEGDLLHDLLAGRMGIAGHPVIEDEQTVRDILTYIRTETRPAPPDFSDIEVPEALLAMEGDVAYGEYLASDCVQCHNASATAAGGRDLAGLGREAFLHLMLGYQQRALPNPVMQAQAGRLNDEELAALAAYFAQSDTTQ